MKFCADRWPIRPADLAADYPRLDAGDANGVPASVHEYQIAVGLEAISPPELAIGLPNPLPSILPRHVVREAPINGWSALRMCNVLNLQALRMRS